MQIKHGNLTVAQTLSGLTQEQVKGMTQEQGGIKGLQD